MKHLLHLLKHDFTLLFRNNIIQVSVLVTAIYIGLFYWLKDLQYAEKILVLIIFNDPTLIGFLFAGVMVLFETNENTLQALSVTPATKAQYILSKTMALTVVALGCCLAMAFAGVGTAFSVIHYCMASVLTTMMFSFFGFVMVAGEATFNRFILKSVGLLMVFSLPFLGYFGVSPRVWFLWVPTQPAIDLFQAALSGEYSPGTLIYAYAALSCWIAVSFYLAWKMMRKSFNPDR